MAHPWDSALHVELTGHLFLNPHRECPGYFDPKAPVVPHPPVAATVAPLANAVVVIQLRLPSVTLFRPLPTVYF